MIPRERRIRITAAVFLCCLALLLAGIKHPPIIALWEAAVVYYVFNPVVKPLPVLAIQEGADSAGYHGRFGYACLTASRWLADIVGHNLFVVRLLPILYGLICLFLFYIVVRRWFGWYVASVAGALLVTNQVFLVFQHSLLPQVLTLATILFCVERLQILNKKPDVGAVLTLGLAFALAGIHYIIGRICILAILAFCVIDFERLSAPGGQSLRRLSSRRRLKITAAAFISMLLWLTLFYPRNLLLFFNREFIFSRLGEYANDAAGGWECIIHNARYFLSYAVLHNHPWSYSSDIMVHIQYPVEGKFIIVLMIIGVVSQLKNLRQDKILMLLYLFGIVMLANLLSLVDTSRSFETSTTLSSFRTFFVSPFIVIFASLALAAIAAKLKQRHSHLGLMAHILIVGLILTRAFLHFSEVHRFQRTVDSHVFDFSQPAVQKKLDDPILPVIERRELHLNQIYFYRLAQTVKEQLKEKDQRGPGRMLIYIPAAVYTPAHYHVGGRVPTRGDPYYFQMFLTLYLRDAGVNVSYLIRRADLVGRYGGWLLRPNGKAETASHFIVNPIGLKKPEYILVASEEELKALEDAGETEIVFAFPER